MARIRGAIAAVVSPGVPPDAPPVAAARQAGVEIVAEVDVAFTALSGTRCVGITGTNGKTTTTALTAHLLNAVGCRAEAAGNIGRPLSEVALGDAPPWLALELSSFQLHDAPHLELAMGILTNLSPDHLDRYPTLSDYYADKARLFASATARSVWVTNADDATVQSLARGVVGAHCTFSLSGPADAWYDHAAQRLMLDDTPLLPRAELALLGDHNVANALAAAVVARRAGGSVEDIAAGLRRFRALAHRLEPVREVAGVLWINDSKATNVASTEVALAALDRPIVLLLGGRHKGEPYTRLAPMLRQHGRGVVAYGEAREAILHDLGTAVPVVGAASFDEVLGRAAALARPGDAVLLSPACSSFDMFRNYEERGERFRSAVEAL